MRFRWRQRTSIDLPWINLSALIILWAVASPFLAVLIRDPSILKTGAGKEPLIYAGVSAVVTIASFLWYRLGHSVSRFFSVAEALTIIKASAAAVLCTLIVCFLLTRLDNIPRSVPVIHFIVLAGGTLAARAERYFRRRRRGRISLSTATPENILILGVTDLSWFYIQIIEEFASDAYTVVAFLDESQTLQGRFVHGYPVAGRIQDLGQVIDEYAIHGVTINRAILAIDPQKLGPELSQRVFATAAAKSVPVDILPDRLGLKRPSTVAEGGGNEARPYTIDVSGPFWTSKRLFDITVGLALLIATAPIALLVAVLVLFDCGMPVIFWQMRIGRHGRRITIYKFRTLQAPYTARGEVRPEDRRVSVIGRLLRLSHIDELPQLVSIVRGEMSFIGPRPLLPADISSDANLRFAVRPGITGWAQVNGGTLLTVEEKNAMDEWYVRHASWKLELIIVLRTIRAMFAAMKRDEAAIREAMTEQMALAKRGPCHQASKPAYSAPSAFSAPSE
ncbi:MAG: sugar transferase [Variibacter sp.]|nr:sugar transferase [Variibacter sp.]